MRVPIYCNETFEALTIIKIEPWALRMLDQGCIFLNFAPVQHVSPYPVEIGDPIKGEIKICSVRFDKIRLRDMESWIGVTKDAETSLQLRSVFLPGQQSEVRQAERDAQSRLMEQMLRGLSR